MKILGLTGIAAGALSVSMAAATPAQAAMYLAQAPLAKSAQTPSLNLDPVRQRASSGSGSRWTPAMQAPGGYAAYRRPFRGYVLPRYWINPRYAISDYRVYNLHAPDNGYRWMRYYDDAVLTDDRGYVYDMEYDLDWNGYETGDIDYDTDGLADGTRVYGGDRYSPPPRQNTRRRISRQGGTYDGEWTGGYVGDDGVYEGTWNGTYINEDGRAYRGQYRGTYRGDSDYRPAPQDDYGADYDRDPTRDWSENDWEQYCRRDNGVGGAVIGGVVGGVAGNRIAGRGNRTAGTLIGAGLGAIAGAVIDKAEDKCHQYRAPQRAETYPDRGYDHGYDTGYDQQQYYYPAPTVTTVVVNDGEDVTTTTTYYEDVAVAPARKSKRKWRPRR